MALQLKPCFYLFQGVRDQLYLNPPMMLEESSSTKAYFSTLSFTKPLEKLVLPTVSLLVLLDWLSKPKGPHLVEASGGANPEKTLAIAVGVGLVYKPHYIPTEPFSATYMHLSVWHMAGFQTELEDKVTSSRLLFVSLSEMSSVLPVAMQHPVLLDVATREMLMASEEPPAPVQLRGFRLHTVWTQQPGEDLTRRVGFPHLFGESSSPLLEYELEIIPQELFQSPKLAITLKPPSKHHWNIVSDLVLPLIQGTLWQRRKAKQAALHPEEGSEGAEASPTEESAPGKSLPVEAEGSGEASSRQRAIDTTQEILECVHAIHLQTMYEMGSMREVDQTLARALMAEFTRMQLIIGQDLTKSLIALQLDLETSSQVLLSDVARTLNLHSTDPASHELKAILQGFQQATSLKVHLPLMELQAAREDLEGFLQQHLQEISSQAETWELVEGLARKMSAHASRVRYLVSIPELAELEVSLWVNAGLAANQSLEANFFSGILEGVAGRLGLVPPGMVDPPASARVGVS